MDTSGSYTRHSSHAGSWYSDLSEELDQQLSTWLHRASATSSSSVKALIGPHAGFSYSGPTAAFAYGCFDVSSVENIFVLGPSHHVYLRGAALSKAISCETPLGSLAVNQTIVSSLLSSHGSVFRTMSQSVDEDEHSIEMHLPYVAKLLADAGRLEEVRIVPIMVGDCSEEGRGEEDIARALLPYFDSDDSLFVISSDFCHWGARFRFTPRDRTEPEEAIHTFIESMDREGMELIEQGDLDGFKAYLERTENTICGRNPIQVLLKLMEVSAFEYAAEFVRYAQSNAVRSVRDSSVSYASAVIRKED